MPVFFYQLSFTAYSQNSFHMKNRFEYEIKITLINIEHIVTIE